MGGVAFNLGNPHLDSSGRGKSGHSGGGRLRPSPTQGPQLPGAARAHGFAQRSTITDADVIEPLPLKDSRTMIEERFIRALHVETLRRTELGAVHSPHVLFQTSTIGALLQGAYEGDVRFADLAEHGDLGLGTLDALDGEMIALDGRFYRADVTGSVEEVDPEARTPFAVVVPFSPSIEVAFDAPLDQAEVLSEIERALPNGAVACALRIDGDFNHVRGRSVPRQRRPYRPLTDVIAQQRCFDLHEVSGTLVGFRFPEYSGAIEVSGFHLHFISSERRRGGHVLDFRAGVVRASLDPVSDLHVELPPGVDLSSPHLDVGIDEAKQIVEHDG